ncbi:hypothetical protein GDO81_015301 [Engystomops pustulosus]|uniref:Uncharacterized protein n=1 Tax=Engystomops pustulosus TaxID=76066 RepID=A0AAV7AMC3_ENGPU|nr:hypothetical protein GDO81_015301 [Engystomops pustulosus]
MAALQGLVTSSTGLFALLQLLCSIKFGFSSVTELTEWVSNMPVTLIFQSDMYVEQKVDTETESSGGNCQHSNSPRSILGTLRMTQLLIHCPISRSRHCHQTEYKTTEIITTKNEKVNLTEYQSNLRGNTTTKDRLQGIMVKDDDESVQEERDTSFKIQLTSFQVPVLSKVDETDSFVSQSISITKEVETIVPHSESPSQETAEKRISDSKTQAKVDIPLSDIVEQKVDMETESSGWKLPAFKLPKIPFFGTSEDDSIIDSTVQSQEVDTVTKTEYKTTEIITTKIEKVDLTEFPVKSESQTQTTKDRLQGIMVKDDDESVQEERDTSFKIQLTSFQVPVCCCRLDKTDRISNPYYYITIFAKNNL